MKKFKVKYKTSSEADAPIYEAIIMADDYEGAASKAMKKLPNITEVVSLLMIYPIWLYSLVGIFGVLLLIKIYKSLFE